MQTLIRVALVATTIISIAAAVVDLADLAFTGAVSVAPHRMVRLELGSVGMSILSTWYLGWKAS